MLFFDVVTRWLSALSELSKLVTLSHAAARIEFCNDTLTRNQNMDTPFMRDFWLVATPRTLASLIADIDNTDHARDQVEALRQACIDELTAIVGDDEAATMIAAAEGGR